MIAPVSRLILVAFGGALGCAGRFALSGLLQRNLQGGFPYGTLAVNVLGCLAAGFLLGMMETRGWSEDTRAFLVPGVLGGFTTFSAFGLETMALWQSGAAGLAALNAAGNLVLGLGGVWAGRKLA